MQNDRWKEITRIFHAALDLPPEDRHGFVSAASRDPEIQSEVEKLLLADEKADSYLESPLIPPGSLIAALTDQPQLRPGDILCQRFHILRAVGSGGMGQVFEAHDSELAVNVALKLIRPEVAANPQALARFRQEVRLARRITHPNVCRTFDLDRDTLTAPDGQQRTLVFLTMEFLDGETLAARLKRTGRLTLDEILVISRQIAAALDAAHALGIIHRDIKPGNIMLVPAGENSRQPARVVITDFGLARLDPVFSQDENSITQHSSHSAHPIGTLAYMAPEQMDGSPISATTDIYAFGLILFEMATGQRAFPSSNLLSGIAQRLSGPPPSPTSLQPGLPQSFEQAIQGCLRLKPEDRFQSAQAVMDCLECRTGQSQPLSAFDNSAGKPQPRPRRWTNWTSRNTLLSVVAILLLAVSLFLLGLRFQWWEGNARLDPGALVYLAPVTNQTGEKSLDNITELLQASLEQSAHINLLDQGRVGDTLQNMTKPADTPIDQPTGREIGMRANAARVIFAQVTGSQGHYTLNVDIQRTDYSSPLSLRSHWPNSFSWQITGNTNSGTIPPELTRTLQNATDWIRKEVGESQDDLAHLDTPPEDVTTSNWQALVDFSIAEKLQKSQQTASAIEELRDAIRLDPQFSLAFAKLGDRLVGLGQYNEGYAAYRNALETDQDRRLSRRQRDEIRGNYALDSNDFEQAESAFRDLTVYYPNDYSGWFHRGYPLMMLGRTDEAIATLKHAYLADPLRPQVPFELGNAYISREDWSSASQWLELAKSGHGEESVADAVGISLFLQGNFVGAERQFRLLIDSAHFEDRSLGYALLTRLYAERRRKDEALQTIGSAIEVHLKARSAEAIASDYLDRAYLRRFAEKLEPCLDDVSAALHHDRSPQTAIRASAILGNILFQRSSRHRERVVELLQSLESDRNFDNFGVIGELAMLRVKGELQLARGDWPDALATFERADKLDAPVNEREYLARVLEQAASHSSDPGVSRLLLLRALDAYGKVALYPGTAWQYAEHWPPGYYGDQLAAYLRLANLTGTRSDLMADALKRYTSLRPSSDRSTGVGQQHPADSQHKP